jgi:hypothetical protein
MDATDPALPPKPFLVGLAAIGGIGPDVGGGIVVRPDIPKHPPVVARCVDGLALADEAEGPADRDAALVAEAENSDVDRRLAVRFALTTFNVQPASVSFRAARAG